jgi:hypothetical protein
MPSLKNDATISKAFQNLYRRCPAVFSARCAGSLDVLWMLLHHTHRVDCSYEVSDQVFLWVKPHNSSIRFGRGTKLSPRFMGPFKIVERKGPVAYQLALPNSLRRMHDVFHVSVLRHYASDPKHVIDLSSLKV